MNKIIIYQVVG